MKKTSLTLSLILISLVLKGQSYDQAIDFGIRGSYEVTNYANYKRSDLPEGSDLRNFGYSLGGFMQFRVNNIYFQPELLYNHTSTIIADQLVGQPNVTAELDMNFNSLQVPLVVGYRTSPSGNAFRIGGGVFFNFLLNSNGVFKEIPGSSVDIPDDFFDGFNNTSMGWRLNVGYDLGPFLFDIAYQQSFSKLAEELSRLGADFTELGKETTWLFKVGYKLFRKQIVSSYE